MSEKSDSNPIEEVFREVVMMQAQPREEEDPYPIEPISRTVEKMKTDLQQIEFRCQKCLAREIRKHERRMIAFTKAMLFWREEMMEEGDEQAAIELRRAAEEGRKSSAMVEGLKAGRVRVQGFCVHRAGGICDGITDEPDDDRSESRFFDDED